MKANSPQCFYNNWKRKYGMQTLNQKKYQEYRMENKQGGIKRSFSYNKFYFEN